MSASARCESQPVHLLELFEPSTGEISSCECFRPLELALEEALRHALQLPEPSSAECSFDDDGELEGVSFFDTRQRMTVCLTVYHLERDTATAANRTLSELCHGPRHALEAGLGLLLSKDH